jgi:hypothetical protein
VAFVSPLFIKAGGRWPAIANFAKMASPLDSDTDEASLDVRMVGSPAASATTSPPGAAHPTRRAKRAIADRAEKPRKQQHRLLEATELASARLRVTREAVGLHCTRAGLIQCNACGCEIAGSGRIPNKKEDSRTLRDSLFHPVWIGYHWKTFFCRECTRIAQAHFNEYFNLDRQCRSEQTENAACLNCLRVDYDSPAICLPICYASDHCPGRPRRIPLCDTCVKSSGDQLALVSYAGPGGSGE